MIAILTTLFFLAALVLLICRVYYYKLAVKNVEVAEFRIFTGFIISPQIFFPLNASFADNVKIKKYKKYQTSFCTPFMLVLPPL
jgi:hypothetical protein